MAQTNFRASDMTGGKKNKKVAAAAPAPTKVFAPKKVEAKVEEAPAAKVEVVEEPVSE